MKKPRLPAALALLAAAGLGIALGVAVWGPPVRAAQGDDVYASSSSDLASDELQVTLAPGGGERLLKVVDVLMGSETVRSLGKDRFLVRQGPNGQRDDWAAFYAALPYVRDVKPKPARKPSEQMPAGKLHLVGPSGGAGGPAPDVPAQETAAPGREYVPGEVLVKFKRGTTQKQIDRFMAETGTKLLGRLDLGEDRIYRLAVPEGVEVPDLASELSENPIVEYAEPNYKMSIPTLPGAKAPTPATSPVAPPPGSTRWPWGKPGDKPGGKVPKPTPPRMPAVPGALSVDTGELLGDSVFVTFRPGVREPVPELVALVFGVEMVEGDESRVRYSLPRGVNPLTAVRIFKLCPYVMGAEPSYGR